MILLSGVCIHYGLSASQGPPTWDGAEHSLYGLRVYQAVAARDISAFTTATTSQNLWPFLHSWALAFIFFLTGPSFAAARFLSLLLWAGTVIATLKMAALCATKNSVREAVMIALILSLTSPMMMLYSVQPMLEMQGAFLTMLTLLAASGQKHSSRMLTGILLLITFFTKYVYAQLLVPALAIHLFIIGIQDYRTASSKRRVLINNLTGILQIFGPVTMGALFWFARPAARAGYMAAVHNPATTEYSVLSPVNLIIYPALLILYYFISPLTGIPSFITCFYKPRHNRMRQLGVLYILVTIIMLTIYWYKLTRAIFTVAPVMFALAAVWPADRIHRSREAQKPFWSRVIWIVLLVHLPFAFVPGWMLKHHPAMRQEARHMLMFEPELQTALESVASEAGSAGPVAIVGDFHTVSPPLVRWVFLLHAEGAAKQSFSLLNWSRPIASFSLADMMQSAGTPQSLMIRVEPGR